jgi:hypothetical protein
VGFYAYFLYKSKASGAGNFLCKGALFLSVITALCVPFIHFMAIPVSMALLMHMIIYARKALREIALPLSVMAAIFFSAHASYIGMLVSTIRDLQPHDHARAFDFWKGWVSPLLGGHLLAGGGLNYFFGDNWLPHSPVFSMLEGITYVAYPLTFAGMVVACKNVWSDRKMFGAMGAAKVPCNVRAHLSLIALVSLALQSVVCGVTRSYYFPHYHNGIFIIHIIFAWLALDWVLLKKLRKVIVPAYGISMAAIVVIVMVLVHERSGTRDGIDYYGATIGNQLDIARKMGKDRNRANCTVAQFTDFPDYWVFERICLKDDAGRLNGPVTIEYANSDSLSGLVRVRSGDRIDNPMAIEAAEVDSVLGLFRVGRPGSK